MLNTAGLMAGLGDLISLLSGQKVRPAGIQRALSFFTWCFFHLFYGHNNKYLMELDTQ